MVGRLGALPSSFGFGTFRRCLDLWIFEFSGFIDLG